MKKIIGLLFLLIFAFVGCQNKQLSEPQNIAYDYEGFIIWDEVENADEYLIKIEDYEIISPIAAYDITDIITRKGIYDVEIIAVSEDYKSSNPAIFLMEVDYNLDANIDLSIQGETLIWEEVFLASRYLVNDGFEFHYAEEGPSFDLSYLPSGNHTITVQVVFPDGSKTEKFMINYTKQ